MNLIKDITVWNFDECLPDVHCPVVIQLAGSTETPTDDSVVVPKRKKMEPRSARFLHLYGIKLKEIIEIENCLQEEPCSLETLNVVNARIVQVIKDSATETSALNEVEKV